MFVFQKGEYMCYAHPLDGFDEKYLGKLLFMCYYEQIIYYFIKLFQGNVLS